MQLESSKAIAVCAGVVVCAACFGSGMLVGRQFPAHHVERFGNTGYLVDVSTGSLCNAFPPVARTPDGFEIVNPNPVDQAIAGGTNHIPPCAVAK